MREAIRLASDSASRGNCGPFGAVLVRHGSIVGRGYNRVVIECDPTAHAEIVAIREACRRLETFSLQGCELYTSCEPCPMCLTAAYWARLDRIFYAASRQDAAMAGFDDALLYHELGKPSGGRSLPMTRLLPQEGLTPFQIWARNPDRIVY